MSRVLGYGVCAVCRQGLHLILGSAKWIHTTPDITHEAVIKSADSEWLDQ